MTAIIDYWCQHALPNSCGSLIGLRAGMLSLNYYTIECDSHVTTQLTTTTILLLLIALSIESV